MQQQLNLIGEPRTLARRSDPITSHAAALRVSEFSGGHKERIVLALQRRGPMNVDGIARATRIQAHAVGKRVTELAFEGVIRPKRVEGESVLATAPGRSGRQQRVWESA